jgi:hypothetical protein
MLREMLTPNSLHIAKMLRMAQVTRIHSGRTPVRIHYIPEHAASRGMKQADIVREMSPDSRIDKSTVSRWFKGSLPKEEHLIALAGLFFGDEEEVSALFLHPDEDWMTRLLRGRSADERKRVMRLFSAAFDQTGTDG